MPHYAIVVVDPAKHHARRKRLHVEHNLAHHAAGDGPAPARLRRAIEQHADALYPAPREAGDLHTVVEGVECPDGLPNCRDCGDEAHAAACAEAGHCPHCGRAGMGGHGVAPDAHLQDGGMALVAVGPPAAGHVWDRDAQAFAAPKR